MDPQVQAYLDACEPSLIQILKKIRTIILRADPNIQESFNYAMPAYKLNGHPLVYFAAFKNHIGFYATPSGHTEFEVELNQYKQGKGSVQFPLNQAIPFDLIERMVAFRVQENLQKKKK